MRKFVLAFAAVTLLRTPAFAAPPVPAPAYDWNGFYLGGYYGASWGQSNASTPGSYLGNVFAGSVDINSTSYTAGVTAGYNLQFSPTWLVGIEGDFGYLGGSQLLDQFNDLGIFVGEKNRWYATLRGRVGYVTGPSLIYLTGGVGFVHVTDTFGGNSAPPTSSSTTTTGGVIGGGIETRLSHNWSAKTEYLYINGGSDHTFQSSVDGTFPAPTVFSHNYQVIKSGLNYRFNGDWDGLPLVNGTTLASNHNWNGFYAGANAGIGTSLTHVHGIGPTLGDNNVNGTGFTGGGQAGYNYMLWQKYLVGIEGDIGALTINQSVGDWNDQRPTSTDVVTFTQKTNWLGTLRGRIGTSTGPALLYLTAGMAWVGLQDGVVPTSAFVPGSLGTKTGTGFTWGGGTEIAIDRHWSAKLESLVVNSGTSNHLVYSFDGTSVQFQERFVIARFGLNYAFN